jgi:hypothetical protein
VQCLCIDLSSSSHSWGFWSERNARCGFLTAVHIKFTVSWNVTPCSLHCYRSTRLDGLTSQKIALYNTWQSACPSRRAGNQRLPTPLPAQRAFTHPPPWLNPGLAIKNVRTAGCFLLINETGLQRQTRSATSSRRMQTSWLRTVVANVRERWSLISRFVWLYKYVLIRVTIELIANK